jgi:hypothetical protein
VAVRRRSQSDAPRPADHDSWTFDAKIKTKKLKDKDEKGREKRAQKKKLRERQGLLVEEEAAPASFAASEVAEIYGEVGSKTGSASINYGSGEASPLVKPESQKRELDSEQQQVGIVKEMGILYFGDKSISTWVSVALLISALNAFGTGVFAMPQIYQQAGWVTPTALIVATCLLSGFSATFLCDAIARIDENGRFDKRVEFEGAACFYSGKTVARVCVVLICVFLSVRAISIINQSAQAVDALIVFLVGKTYAIQLFPFKPLTWGQDDWDACASSSTLHASSLCVPFGQSGAGAGDLSPISADWPPFIITLGYVLLMLTVSPLGWFSMGTAAWLQLVPVALLLALVALTFAHTVLTPSALPHTEKLGPHHHRTSAFTGEYEMSSAFWLPAFGEAPAAALDIVTSGFACVLLVPSWLHEKRAEVRINRVVWSSFSTTAALYILVGVMGAYAYPGLHALQVHRDLYDGRQPHIGNQQQPHIGTVHESVHASSGSGMHGRHLLTVRSHGLASNSGGISGVGAVGGVGGVREGTGTDRLVVGDSATAVIQADHSSMAAMARLMEGNTPEAQVIAGINQCTFSAAGINQCTYSIAVINQCTSSAAGINQCTYSIAVINQCTYSIPSPPTFSHHPLLPHSPPTLSHHSLCTLSPHSLTTPSHSLSPPSLPPPGLALSDDAAPPSKRR